MNHAEALHHTNNVLPKRRTTVTRVGLAVTFLVALAWVVIWATSGPSSKSEQEVRKVAEKLVFEMPANGDSAHISPPAGYAVRIKSGSGYRLHYVYADGTVGTFGDPNSPSGNGHITDVYVHDTTGRSNSVTYEFVRP